MEGLELSAGVELSRKPVKLDLLILLLLCLVMFFFSLGSRPLWDIDEGMHAATSRDMVTSGDWITPRLNGEPFHDKPALFNWMVALSFLVFGFTELAARLPAALLGTGVVLTTYLLGRTMFNRTVGLAAGIVLATSLEMIVMSRSVVHDSALLFFVTLALFCFWQAFSDNGRRMLWLMLCSASCGFAVLAKGPVGLVLPALVVVPFLLVRRTPGFFRVSELLLGGLIFLVIVIPWYALVMVSNPDYAGYFFIKQNVGSFLSSEPTHINPPYYYVVCVLGGFFPWSFVLPVAAWAGRPPKQAESRAAWQFLLIWFAAVFLFFTAASSRLVTYILPLFPAAALLVGHGWHELATRSRSRSGFSFSLLAASTLFVVAAIAFQVEPPLDWQHRYGVNLQHLDLLVWTVVVGWVAALALHRAHRAWASFASITGMMVCFVLLVTLLIVPPVNPYRTTERLARELDERLPPDEPLVFYRDLEDSSLFYTDRRAVILSTRQELAKLMESTERRYCIVREWRYERFVNDGWVLPVVDREGRKLLISNRPDPEVSRTPEHDVVSTPGPHVSHDP